MRPYTSTPAISDDCAVLDTVRLGAAPVGRLGPSTLSTEPKRSDSSCKLKWPDSSG